MTTVCTPIAPPKQRGSLARGGRSSGLRPRLGTGGLFTGLHPASCGHARPPTPHTSVLAAARRAWCRINPSESCQSSYQSPFCLRGLGVWILPTPMIRAGITGGLYTLLSHAPPHPPATCFGLTIPA